MIWLPILYNLSDADDMIDNMPTRGCNLKFHFREKSNVKLLFFASILSRLEYESIRHSKRGVM